MTDLGASKALARRAIDVWSTGDVAEIARIYADTYVNHQHHDPDDPRDLVGLDAMRGFVEEFRAAFPDFHDTVDVQLAEDDLVATRFTSTGTQRGPFLGRPATDRVLTWTGTTIDRVVDGRIVESWANWDLFGLLQQMDAGAR